MNMEIHLEKQAILAADHVNLLYAHMLKGNFADFKRVFAMRRDTVNVQFVPKTLPPALANFRMGRVALLHAACFVGRLKFAKFLVKNGASFNVCDETFGGTALHWAAFGQQAKIAEYLIFDLGISRDVRNRFNQTAYDLVAAGASQAQWEFLAPTWMLRAPSAKKAPLLEAFRRAVGASVDDASDVKFYTVLSALPSFNTIRSRIAAGVYVFASESDVYAFFADVKLMLREAKTMQVAAENTKRALKRLRALFCTEVFRPAATRKQLSAGSPLFFVNFPISPSLRCDQMTAAEATFVRELRLVPCDGRIPRVDLRSRDLLRAHSFCFALPAEDAAEFVKFSIHLLCRDDTVASTRLPSAFVDLGRIPTTATAPAHFSWEFCVRRGAAHLLEVFVTGDVQFDYAARTVKLSPNSQVPATKKLFTAFVSVQ